MEVELAARLLRARATVPRPDRRRQRREDRTVRWRVAVQHRLDADDPNRPRAVTLDHELDGDGRDIYRPVDAEPVS